MKSSRGSWPSGIGAIVLAMAVVGCGGEEEKDEQDDISPEDSCANLVQVCPEFPVSEEECVMRAVDFEAPQSEVNCVGEAANCDEVRVCLGVGQEEWDEALAAGMGGAGN